MSHNKKTFEDLGFTDNFIFAATMQHKELSREIAEILLGIPVKSAELLERAQNVQAGYENRGVPLQVQLGDEDQAIRLELQVLSNGEEDLVGRARYYHSTIDFDWLQTNQDLSMLPPVYVVFVCLFDPFGMGIPQYTTKAVINETGESAGYDSCTIFYNADAHGAATTEKLQELLQYMKTGSWVKGGISEKLEKQVNLVKKSPEQREKFMALDLAFWEAREKGREEVMERLILKALKKGRSKEFILEEFECTEEAYEKALRSLGEA